MAAAEAVTADAPAAAAEQPVSDAQAASGGRIFVSPRARKLAADKGVTLSMVAGSGPEGRIIEKDVVAYMEAAPKATPVAQRVAEQLGVDLRTVTGTGPQGRITKGDVQASVAVPEAAPVLWQQPNLWLRHLPQRSPP